jgi:tetratricopeptide (TPR) repeat protein
MTMVKQTVDFWHMKVSSLLLLTLLFTFTEVPVSAQESLSQAQRYALDGQKDWAFMEYHSFLRRNPQDSQAPYAAFGVGEYLYQRGNYQKSREIFLSIHSPDFDYEWAGVLVALYVAKCSDALNDTASAAVYRKKANTLFFSQQRVFVFDKSRKLSWVSPLGNRYLSEEFVDKLEIRLNGKGFENIRV